MSICLTCQFDFIANIVDLANITIARVSHGCTPRRCTTKNAKRSW